jgi:hypothetical protein
MDAKIICTSGSMAGMCEGLKRTHLNVLHIAICNRRGYFTFVQKSHFAHYIIIITCWGRRGRDSVVV